jgi:hypothetical protein
VVGLVMPLICATCAVVALGGITLSLFDGDALVVVGGDGEGRVIEFAGK